MNRIMFLICLSITILGANLIQTSFADDAKPAAKPDAKPAETKNAKPAEAPEPQEKPAAKPESKTDVKPAAKPDEKPAPKTEAKPAPNSAARPATSFMKEVAPILVQNCIACHNPKKSESKYIMTNFKQLAKGGRQGEGLTLEPGDPDASYLVELIRPAGSPRMPYKQDPLLPEQIATIERWVKDGAKYDGAPPDEDWTAVLRRSIVVDIPETYPAPTPITAIAFSPDGTSIDTSGYHEINFWNIADGAATRRLRGLAERVYKIAYSPDGKWLATASGDPGQFGSVKLWIAEAAGGGKPARDLLETGDCVFAVAFSPDNRLVAAAGADRTLRVWEIESGKLTAQIEDHADWILDLAFSPDGQKIATASRDKTSKVFDLKTKEAVSTFPGHNETVYSVTFSQDGKSVMSAGGDNRVRVWNPGDDARQIREIGGFGGPVFQIKLTPDGKQLLACGQDQIVRVFDAIGGAPVRTMQGHRDWVYSVAVSPDGKSITSGSWDGEARIWNLADGKLLRTIVAAPGYKPANATAAK